MKVEKIIHYTETAPNPVGPYSQAVEIDGTIYCSGQISIDPKTNELFLGDVTRQTEMVMSNIENVLKSVNLSFENVIKTMIFLKNMNDFTTMNTVYEKAFLKNPPARSCVAVSGLPKGVSVEIEVIAKRF